MAGLCRRRGARGRQLYPFATKDLLMRLQVPCPGPPTLPPRAREHGLRRLIPDRPQGGRPLQRVAWLASVLAVLISASLTGCSSLAAPNGAMPAVGPDPSFRDMIANHLKKTLKNYTAYDTFQISDPRWVHSFTGWNWLSCIRFADHGRVRTYSVFFNANKIVDDRFAVQTDACDTQTYSPFERMSGLEPLY